MTPEVEKFSIEKAESLEKAESCLRPIGKLTLPSLRARQISFEALEERAQIQEALNGRR